MANTDVKRRRFLTRGRVVAVIIAAALLVALAVWLLLPNVTVRGEVRIVEAELRPPETLALVVESCNGDPEVTTLRLTDDDVQVAVKASSTPFSGGEDCLDVVEVDLGAPLGQRTVVDMHSGQRVEVSGAG